MNIILQRNSPDFLVELRELIALSARGDEEDIESIKCGDVTLGSSIDVQRLRSSDALCMDIPSDDTRLSRKRHREKRQPYSARKSTGGIARRICDDDDV